MEEKRRDSNKTEKKKSKLLNKKVKVEWNML